MSFRKRNLPHLERPGGTYFITFTRLREAQVDLTNPNVATIIISALHHFAGVRYWLYGHTVMPDHVHVILQPIERDGQVKPLHDIMHSIKSWTANRINKAAGRSGSLWLDESHDRLIRSPSDFREKAQYIWQNPAKAGLIDDPADWPWWGNGEEEGQD
jgi:putative transposase